jgi:hypothetical protein
MADYQLTATEHVIQKVVNRNGEVADACIPPDPENMDWIAYQKWLAEGGVPDPYVEPPPPPPSQGEVLALDHENRIRTLEGQPVLTMDGFMAHRKTLKP